MVLPSSLTNLLSPPSFPTSLHASSTQLPRSSHALRRRAPRSFPPPFRPPPSLCLAWNTRRLVVVAAKKTSRNGAREGGGEMGLDDRDLMELEFGRLLGEPQDKTLSKVIMRKTDPDVAYIEIEKSTKKAQQLTKRFLKPEPDRFLRQLEKQQKDAESSSFSLRVPEQSGPLPHLTSPPVRLRIESGSLSQALKVDSTAKLAVNKRSTSIDSPDDHFDCFLRKPSSSVSPKNIMSGMVENTKGQNIQFIKKGTDYDKLLRMPFVTAGNIAENNYAKDLDVIWMDDNRESNGNPIDNFLDLHFNKGQEESLPVSSDRKNSQIEKSSWHGSGAVDTSFGSLIEENAIGKVVDYGNITKSDLYEGRFQQLHVMDTAFEVGRTLALDDLACVSSLAEEAKDAHPAKHAFTSGSVSQIRRKLKPSCCKDTTDVRKAGDLVGRQINVGQQAKSSSSAGKLVPDELNSRNGPSCVEPLASLVRPCLVSSTQKPYLGMACPSHDKRMEQGTQNVATFEEECLLAGTSVLPTASSTACSEAQERQRIKLLKRPASIWQSADAAFSLDGMEQHDQDQESTSTVEASLTELLDDVCENVPALKKPPYTATNFPASEVHGQPSFLEDEDRDWAHAESLSKSKGQVEVKFVGSNSSGLFVSFGCLVGFLPLFELSVKRNIPEFPVWAQLKGFAVSSRRVNEFDEASSLVQEGSSGQNFSERNALVYVTEENRKDLMNKYDKEIKKLLSSFVGQKAWLAVKTVDRKSRRLRFSEKEANLESQELVQKKAGLMAKLNIGDVVLCEVKKITPIGVFVELQGVPALIHHSEISWNSMGDPNYLLRIGEVVEAKVCRLDRFLQRINLSLKQMEPDPLLETLESLVGDADASITQLNESEETCLEGVSWRELETLMKKLEEMEGIASVLKGRRLCGTALATTFQVFLSGPLDDGYKVLARLGNEIQEVFVKTTLDRESMKEAIKISTFREH